MRCTPYKVQAHETHAREMHAYEVHDPKVYPPEIHTHDMHAYEMHACQIHAHETYAHEMVAEKPEMKSVIKDIINEIGSGSEVEPRIYPDSSHSCRYCLIGIY